MTRTAPWSRLMGKIRLLARLGELDKLDRLQEAVGRIEARQLRMETAQPLNRQEFTVYSQHGEDGILQYLLRHVRIANRTFVEFGVGNYRQANTRFLAINDHWSGLVMDSDPDNIRQIWADPIFWSINVRAEHAFVTRENIDHLLQANGLAGEIGLLSIDIDGNDYWVFEAISSVRPAVVIVEYNARFGPDRAVSIPYDPAFNRWAAHPSGVYAGASLRALANLADRKGYALVGCNSFGVNAFFVRSDLLTTEVSKVTVEEGFVPGQFREARDASGNLTFMGSAEEQAILATLPLVEFNDAGEAVAGRG